MRLPTTLSGWCGVACSSTGVLAHVVVQQAITRSMILPGSTVDLLTGLVVVGFYAVGVGCKSDRVVRETRQLTVGGPAAHRSLSGRLRDGDSACCRYPLACGHAPVESPTGPGLVPLVGAKLSFSGSLRK